MSFTPIAAYRRNHSPVFDFIRYHGKERRKETGNINASLMALKDCIRARASGKILGFQYRRSKLTMALKCSFTLPTARTIVIATVSPASKDTEHSLNTLRHACIMHGQQDNSKPGDRETRFVTGGTVVTEQIGEINLTEIGRKNANIKRAGGVMDGPKTNNGNLIVDSKAAKAANNEVELTDKERLRLRKAAETRSIAKLLPQYRDMLKHFRGLLGQNRQQASRLQRMPTDANAVIEEELPYESPVRSASPGENSDAEQDEVDDPVNDFHSSLNKNKNRLDLHEIVTASGTMTSQSDNESVEDDVDGYFERNCYDRQPGKSRKPSSPANRTALKKLNEKASPGKNTAYYDNYEQEQDEEVEEEERMLAEELRAQVPVPRSRSSKPVASQPAVLPSSGSSQRSKVPAASEKVMSPPHPPTGRDERPSPGQKRLEFQKLYNTIYDGAEGCPEHILRRQLTSLLGLHGYTEGEIELMFEMHVLMQENEAMKRAAQEARVQRPAPKAEQQTRPQQRQQYEEAPVQKRSHREPVYHDEEPIQVPVPRGKVVNSPVPAAQVQPRAAEYNAVEESTSAKRSSSTRRGTTSAAPDKAALNKLPTSLAQEQKQARLAEEKERREQEAMAEAAAALEQQNALRRARQDAAKALRDQQEEARRRKAAELKPQPKKAAEPVATRSNLEDPIETGSTAAASRNSIRKHEEEITSLMEQLSMEGNTEATNYALKKSIAVRKAALLRERRAAAQKSYLEDEYEDPVVPIKKASRYGASFDVNLDAAGQPLAPLERGGSSKSASRPKPAGFDLPSRSENDDYAPLGAVPGRKVQNSPPRGGVQNNGAFSSRVAQARAIEPSEAFGGPRWQSTEEPGDQYYQQAEPYQQQNHSRSTSNLPTQSAGGAQFKSPQQLRMEQYHGYSPRGGQQDSYDEAASSRQVRASPRIEEPVPVQRRRVMGAAAAPFGNDFSYDQAP